MRIGTIISAIESFAPPALQEKWDNTGLQVGNPAEECSGVLLCVDVTEDIIAEAAEKGCNLVLSHHPLLFHGLKSISGATAQERAVIAAIRLGIAVYSTHTALDSTVGGISYTMARMLGADVVSVLEPACGKMEKITVYAPRSKADDVKLLLLDLGSGTKIGAGNTADPLRPDDAVCLSHDIEAEVLSLPKTDSEASGSANDDLDSLMRHEALTRIETQVPSWRLGSIMSALSEAEIWPNLSVEVCTLDNTDPGCGLGVYAVFSEPVSLQELVNRVKDTFGCTTIRMSSRPEPCEGGITRIGLCGGSGGEFIARARRCGAQAYISADIRYHDFADCQNSIILMDIGHFESESCAKDIFYRILTNKFPNFAVYYSELEKNPVKYL